MHSRPVLSMSFYTSQGSVYTNPYQEMVKQAALEQQCRKQKVETALIGINEAVMNFFPKDENKLSKYETKGQRLYTKRDPSYFQQIEANLKRINDELQRVQNG